MLVSSPTRRAVGRDFSYEFNLLGRQSSDVGLNARYVSSWVSIAGNQAEMNRVRERATDNRYRRRRLVGFDGLQCRGAAMISGLTRATISSMVATLSVNMSNRFMTLMFRPCS